MKIAIKSNKELMFPPSFMGIVTMSIDWIIDRPEPEVYELKIIDSCTKEVQEEIPIPEGQEGETELKTITKTLGTVTRFKTYTYEEIKQLAASAGFEFSGTLTPEIVNQQFRIGLLAQTQYECNNPGPNDVKGRYYSEALDWEIVGD